MQKTKKEIILEIAAFYGEDPSRRAVIKEDGRAKCRYSEIENLEDVLMPEYRGHDICFWERLQEFHDCDVHFTDTGLSELGERRLEFLLEQYANN